MKLFALTTSAVLCIGLTAHSQSLTTHRDEIDAAQTKIKPALQTYGTCVTVHDLSPCSDTLVALATDPWLQYAAGTILFSVDTAHSFAMHEKAWQAHQDDENTTLEYAIELHRRGRYTDAVKLYELCLKKHPDEFTLHVWLADCYINLGKIDQAVAEWSKADHHRNHTGIDMAINTIYGRTDKMQQRNLLRNELITGQTSAAPLLIVGDANWEVDPWNRVQEADFIEADMRLVQSKMDTTSADYQQLKCYASIKQLTQSETTNEKEVISKLLKAAGLILDSKPLPASGAIASDLLHLAIKNSLVDPHEYYEKHGDEILKQAKRSKDVEMLNIYAFLQADAKGKVDPAIDKLGWKEFKDERFAVSYFIGKGEKNRSDDAELKEALSDFPGSSPLYLIKLLCAMTAKKPTRDLLIEQIKRDFHTVLKSDPNQFSDQLDGYFKALATAK